MNRYVAHIKIKTEQAIKFELLWIVVQVFSPFGQQDMLCTKAKRNILGDLAIVIVQVIPVELHIILGCGKDPALQNFIDSCAGQVAGGLRIGQRIEGGQIFLLVGLALGLALLLRRLGLFLYVVVLAVHGKGLGNDAIQIKRLLEMQLGIAKRKKY